MSRDSLRFIESLELRRFLSADILDSSTPDLLAIQSLNVPLTTQSTSIQTQTTLSISGDHLEGATLTLTATVSNPDPSAPTPTGTVAFLAIAPSSAIKYPANYPQVRYIDPERGGKPAYLLGSATLLQSTASIEVNALSPGNHNIIAVFLGQDLVLPADKLDNYPLLAPGINSPARLMPEYVGHSYQVASIVLTGNRPFQIKGAAVSLLDSAPANAITIPDAGQQLYLYSDNAFAAVNDPLRIDFYSDTGRDYGGFRQYSITRYPSPIPSLLPINPDLQTSRSDVSTFFMKAQTHINPKAWGSHTFTNPPTISATIGTAKDATVNTCWYGPKDRGSFLSATAGLHINGGGSSGGSGVIIDYTCSNAYAGPMPTGSIRFYDGNTLLATVPLKLGVAAYIPPVRSLSLGQHSIRTVYDGDANFLPATSTFDIEITKTPTYTTLYAPSIVGEGANFDLSATVSTHVFETVAPTGLVSFFIDDQPVAQVALADIKFMDLHLSLGTHTLRADYAGSDAALPSTDSRTIEVVPPSQAPVLPPPPRLSTAINFSSSPISEKPSRRFRILTRVFTAYPGIVPSGTLALFIDGKKFASVPVGQKLTFPADLSNGFHKFRLAYSGDTHSLESRTQNYRFRVKSRRVTSMQSLFVFSPLPLNLG